jgi:hypothetical protein
LAQQINQIDATKSQLGVAKERVELTVVHQQNEVLAARSKVESAKAKYDQTLSDVDGTEGKVNSGGA